MKVLLVLMFLGLTSASASANPLEDYITSSLITLKYTMPSGIPELNIPAMDPLGLPGIQESIKMPLGQVDLSLDYVAAWNLSNYDVRFVAVNNFNGSSTNQTLSIMLHMPIIGLDGEYKLEGSILGFPFAGEGFLEMSTMGVTVVANATMTTDAKNVTTIGSMQTKVYARHNYLALENWVGKNDSITTGVVANISSTLFRKYQPYIEDALNTTFANGLKAALLMREAEPLVRRELPSPIGVYEAGNANEFLDHVMDQARPKLAEMDPLNLPEAVAGFEKYILGIKVHGEAKVYDGKLAGIQTLHRTGDAEMTQSEDMTQLKISAHLGMANLHGSYNMHAKFMNLGPTGHASIKVSMVSVEVHVTIDLSSGKPVFNLDHFDINYIGKIDIYFDGLGPLDWIINSLGNWVVNLVKHKIVDAIKGPLHQLIAEKLATAEIPFPG